MSTKAKTGQLSLELLNFEGIVTSLKLGDMQIQYDVSGTDESKIDSLISYLINGRKGELICYRKMRW